MINLILFLVAAVLSVNAEAFDFSGHWKDTQNGLMTCKNGYKVKCDFDQYINYDMSLDPGGYAAVFTLLSNISCATPDAIQLSLRTREAFVSKSSIIYYQDGSFQHRRECGSITSSSIQLECLGDMLSVNSNYFAIQFTAKKINFVLDSTGSLKVSVPIKIYKEECEIKGSLSSVFP